MYVKHSLRPPMKLYNVNFLQTAQHPESPLLRGFKNLYMTLGNIQTTTVDPLTYVEPFLDVIRSDETSGPITGVALSSVHKFLK